MLLFTTKVCARQEQSVAGTNVNVTVADVGLIDWDKNSVSNMILPVKNCQPGRRNHQQHPLDTPRNDRDRFRQNSSLALPGLQPVK